MSAPQVYMDYQASTPLDKAVVEAMRTCLEVEFANPHSSEHAAGWAANAALESASSCIARFLRVDPDELVFTSGATESNNLALLGMAELANPSRKRCLVAETEHKSTLEAAQKASRLYGIDVGFIPTLRDGTVDMRALSTQLNESVYLVSVSAVNNELGTVQDLRAISELCRSVGSLLHSDASQVPAGGDLACVVRNADLLSLSGHKIYGPKGIGLLYVTRESQKGLAAQIVGGGQQRGLRAGTVPVALCVGIAKAIELCCDPDGQQERETVRTFRDSLFERVVAGHPDCLLNGPEFANRHPGNLNLRVPGLSAAHLISTLQPSLCFSTGSACSSGTIQSSHVLQAIGLTENEAGASFRLSLGRFTTQEDVDLAADLLIAGITNCKLALG